MGKLLIILLPMSMGTQHTQSISLRDVLYLPDLEKNYLSVSATTRLGAAVMFEDGELSFIDPERVGCGEIFP